MDFGTAKKCAEWFALLSGALYLPGELCSLLHHSNLLKWTIFATNTMIVLWIFQLRIREDATTTEKPAKQSDETCAQASAVAPLPDLFGC
jgi:Predicted membrane protein (DUF2127)